MTARTGHRQSSSSSSSELHCKSCNAQSLCPLVHFISLSLRPFLAPCACSMSALLQFSSDLHCQSCNAQSPPLPSKTLRGTPSLFAVSVWPLRERLGQSTVTVQHRLLPRANVSRMYAECFDKVLCHENSRILKCKMTNVITRVCQVLRIPLILTFYFFISFFD
jgi:hypothetical protein